MARLRLRFWKGQEPSSPAIRNGKFSNRWRSKRTRQAIVLTTRLRWLAEMLAKNPDDLSVLVRMTQVGTEEARKRNRKHTEVALQYGLKAIALIEAGTTHKDRPGPTLPANGNSLSGCRKHRRGEVALNKSVDTGPAGSVKLRITRKSYQRGLHRADERKSENDRGSQKPFWT